MKTLMFLPVLLLMGCAIDGALPKRDGVRASMDGLVFEQQWVEDRWCFRLGGGSFDEWRPKDLPDGVVAVMWVCDQTPPKGFERWSLKTERVLVWGEVDRFFNTRLLAHPKQDFLMPMVWDGEIDVDRRIDW